MSEILEELKDRFDDYPEFVQFDNGSDFKNAVVKELLKEKKRKNGEGIKSFSTLVKKSKRRYDETEDEQKYDKSTVLLNRKAALVERLNRTLKAIMWKYCTQHNTKRWVDILDDATFNYNHSINRSIKMMPEDVNEENEGKVWLTLYGDKKAEEKRQNFNLEMLFKLKNIMPELGLKKDTKKFYELIICDFCCILKIPKQSTRY